MNTSDWKEFRLGDWFDVRKGKRLTSEDQEPGQTPYIGAIDSNNGVANHIAQMPIHDGNTISLSYNGSVGEAFYQPEPYWSTDDVNALYLKDCADHPMNEAIGLFVATILKQEKYRFSYGRKWILPNMENAIIKLPADGDGNPDWDWMEHYVASLNSRMLTTSVSPSYVSFDTLRWKEFRLNELYDITTGDGYSRNAMTEFDPAVNFVSRISFDNGVVGRVDRLDGVEPHPAGLMTIALGGSYLGSAFVQLEPFYTAAHMSIATPRFDEMNLMVQLFIATLIRKEARSKYCAFGRELDTHINKEFSIKLPVEENGTPDWLQMERFMKSLPYSDRVLEV